MIETWATESNQDLLAIPSYEHEQCIRSNKNRGGGTRLYIHNSIQYRRRDELAFSKNLYVSVFIEVDKTIFNTIKIHEISVNKAQSVISSLSNSAAGFDEIPASIIKQLVNYYTEPLTHLINQSILQGYFPEELKLAKVLPIYKSEDEQLVQNYRPISVLPFCSKKHSTQ